MFPISDINFKLFDNYFICKHEIYFSVNRCFKVFHDVISLDMEGFQWLNPPKNFEIVNDGVKIVTKDHTDFWQRTQHEFRNDNGHIFYKNIDNDFVLSARCQYEYKAIYDHCGIIIRIDEDNWIKTCTEFESAKISYIGTVVTNLGYSDWSKHEISSDITSFYHRIERKGNDIFVSYSSDGITYKEERVCHIHKPANEIIVGVFACSPQGDGISCTIDQIQIKQ